MFSIVVLFSVVASLVDAAPLAMSDAKSNGLEERFYRNGHQFQSKPVWTDGTPCWHGGRFGYLKDHSCSVLDLDLDVVGLVKRKGFPAFTDGTPCWNDDKFGYIEGAGCIAVDVEVKRGYQLYPYGEPVWLDGTPCWYQNQFGYLKDRTCSFVDLDLDLGLVKKDIHHYRPTPHFVDQTPCWMNEHFGYILNDLCIALDLKVKRGFYPTSHYQNGRPTFANGAPCWENGRFGHFENDLCLIADLDLGVLDLVKKGWYNGKPVYYDGIPCWREGKFGYLKDRKCALINLDLDLHLKRDSLPYLVDGTPCWNENNFGYIDNQRCDIVGVDISVEKRLLEGTGLGGLIGESDYKFANSHPGNTPPAKGVGLLGLKRNGLLGGHDGDLLGGSTKSIDQLVGYSLHKRGLVEESHRDLYKSGYYDDDDVVAKLTAATDLGDKHAGYGHGIVPALGLKRSLGGPDSIVRGVKEKREIVNGKKGGLDLNRLTGGIVS